MLERLAVVVSDRESRPRAFLAAARLLAGLSRANLAAVDTAIRAESREELRQRIDALEVTIGKGGKTWDRSQAG
jgi:hypothetical protein